MDTNNVDWKSVKWGEPIVPAGWIVEKKLVPEVKPEMIITLIAMRFVTAWSLQRALRKFSVELSYKQALAAQTVAYMLSSTRYPNYVQLTKARTLR